MSTQVLCVGIATLDIVNQVDCYPQEDSEVRALAQQLRAGGNAANSARVLAQLGADAHWVGNLSDQPQTQLVRQAFARCGVDISRASLVAGSAMPTSYITLSRATGSRSIVHFRDMPEYRAQDFSELDLRAFDWLHFEGRAVAQLKPMMQRARNLCEVPLSLEVEKVRPGIEALFELADILMFSREYAQARGCNSASEWLQQLPTGLVATCTWGSEGAWARDASGELLYQPAHHPARVVDTLGAGDVFNAALIHAIASGNALAEALRMAVYVAGEQCGREGLEGING